MRNVRTYIPLIVLSALFLLGLLFSLYRNVPINPDIRATLSQLHAGMDRKSAMSVACMSFVLDRKVIYDRRDIDDYWDHPTGTNIVKMVSGRIPAIGIGYEIRLGFTASDQLCDVIYKPRKGLVWFLYLDRKPHEWSFKEP